MGKLTAEATLDRADILICCLGAIDVLRQTRPRTFLRNYRVLVQELSMRTGAKLAIINGLPPMHILPAAPQPLRWYLGQCAHKLDAVLRSWTSRDPDLEYVSLQWYATSADLAADRFHPGLTQYESWARMIADRIDLRWPPL